MPDEVGDKSNRFMFPKWWLVFQRERYFQYMKGHDCLDGHKSLEEHGGRMIFFEEYVGSEHNLRLSHLHQKDVL
jgi:hypothetical protein